MIRKLSGESPAFVLDTRNTSYAFKIMETGQPEHLYYGAKITVNEMADLEALSEKRAFQQGNSIAYDQEHLSFTLEDVSLEMSGYGKGDIREPFVEVVAADGSFTTDFVYESDEIKSGKNELKTLPSSFGDEVEGLHVTFKDKNNGYIIVLSYYVYEKEDVIGTD